MMLSTEHIQADLNRQFADWGETVTHRSVAAIFDPETLSNDETITEIQLTALVTANQADTTVGTGGQYQDPQISFTFRTSDLPETTNGQIRRIVYQDQIYDVIGVDVLATGQVTTLHCRKRANA